jgi:hypothetical protein
MKEIPRKKPQGKFWSPDDDAEFDDEGNEIEARHGFHGMINSETKFLTGEAGYERVDITPKNKMNDYGNYGNNFNYQDLFSTGKKKGKSNDVGFGNSNFNMKDVFSTKQKKGKSNDFGFGSAYDKDIFSAKKTKKNNMGWNF